LEQHPFEPFFPDKARWLFLGTFPPKKARWAMKFFYPNFYNDMWRIFGLIFFADENNFVNIKEKTFKYEDIISLLKEKHIAMYDVGKAVIRHKDNASDKNLEIVETIDIKKIIQECQSLQNIVATGEKAADAIVKNLKENGMEICSPGIGKYYSFDFEGRTLRLYRMPSSSRACRITLKEKSHVYKKMFYE
jgi:G:T/U-mismatch repair DNA glycosylase